jgi:hypothetical protein
MVLGERGQIMGLGVFAILLVALMMFLTLNVGQSVYQKIRLQQLADSAAYSMATQEARAFNYFAYSNRANLGSLVALTSAHSMMSMASSVPEMFDSGNTNYIAMGVEEIILCLTCCWPWCFSMCKHCIHAINDFMIADDYADERDDLRDDVESLDDIFKALVMALDFHMMRIFADQLQTYAQTGAQLAGDRITKDLTSPDRGYAPKLPSGELKDLGGIPAYNARNFWNAMLNPFTDDSDRMKFEPTEAANGTLYRDWVPDHPTAYLYTSPLTLLDLMMDIPDDGFTIITNNSGQGRVVQEPGDPPDSEISEDTHGKAGNAVAAYDEGGCFSFLENDCFPMWWDDWDAWVASADDDGTKSHKQACDDEDDHDLTCLGSGLFGMTKGCFIIYKGEKEAKDRFGQPVVYSVLSMDLSIGEDAAELPWDLNDQGTVTVDFKGTVGKQTVHLTNKKDRAARDKGEKPGEGVAMSKGQVYYHHPGGWKEYPNLFNPYWRGKLQPYVSDDAITVLTLAGNGLLAKYASLPFIAPLP